MRFTYPFFLCLGGILLGMDLNRGPTNNGLNQIERIHLDYRPGTYVVDRDVTFGRDQQRVRLRIAVDLNIDPCIKAAHLATNVYYKGRVIAKKDVEITWD